MVEKQRKRLLLLLAWLLLLGDLGFSFYQFYGMGLDGDLAAIVAPSEHYTPVLSDPFGWSVLTEGAVYAAPNRYFVHASMVAWFEYVPNFFGRFFEPITALFVAVACFKLLLQLALLLVGVRFVRLISPKNSSVRSLLNSFSLLALLLFPFFQNGFLNPVMGIIQASVTYSFFYAFPLLLICIWLYPLVRSFRTGQTIEPGTYLWLFPLTIALPFTGPLVAGIIPVIFLLWVVALFLKNARSVGSGWRNSSTTILALGTALCLYSVYIGTYNAENPTDTLPLAERYARLPWGILYLFQVKLGLSLLAVAVGGMTVWMHRKFPSATLSRCGLYLLLFASIYLLLLPLGGYRAYRSNIVRADTFLPVTIVLVFYFALLARYLMRKLRGRPRFWFVGFVGLLLGYFTLCDEPRVYTNLCEREALHRIAAARTGLVLIEEDCHILSWNTDHDPAATVEKALFLQKVGVLDSIRLWYVSK